MKNKIFTLLVVAGLVMISCEKEQIDTVTDPGAAKQLELNTTTGSESQIDATVFAKDGAAYAEGFENSLLWFAYTAAKTLRKNPGARLQFGAALDANNTVTAAVLFNQAVGNNIFRERFESEMWYDICATISCGRPDRKEGDPLPPFVPPPPPIIMSDVGNTIGGLTMIGKGGDDGGHPGPTVDDLLEQFMNWVINDSCVELHVPNGIDYGSDKSIYAVAHPLDASNANLGKEYYPVPILHDDGIPYEADPKNVNPFLVSSEGNVIIARPTIVASTLGCDYSTQFGVSDFTLFLDY